MLFKSTVLPVPDGATRRLLSNTSDRPVPKPRKSTVAVPLPGLLEARPKLGKTCGIWLRVSSSVGWTAKAMTSLLIVVSGLGVLKSRRAIRVPVTITSSRKSSLSKSLISADSAGISAASTGCGFVSLCANAQIESIKRTTPVRIRSRRAIACLLTDARSFY